MKIYGLPFRASGMNIQKCIPAEPQSPIFLGFFSNHNGRNHQKYEMPLWKDVTHNNRRDHPSC